MAFPVLISSSLGSPNQQWRNSRTLRIKEIDLTLTEKKKPVWPGWIPSLFLTTSLDSTTRSKMPVHQVAVAWHRLAKTHWSSGKVSWDLSPGTFRLVRLCCMFFFKYIHPTMVGAELFEAPPPFCLPPNWSLAMARIGPDISHLDPLGKSDSFEPWYWHPKRINGIDDAGILLYLLGEFNVVQSYLNPTTSPSLLVIPSYISSDGKLPILHLPSWSFNPLRYGSSVLPLFRLYPLWHRSGSHPCRAPAMEWWHQSVDFFFLTKNLGFSIFNIDCQRTHDRWQKTVDFFCFWWIQKFSSLSGAYEKKTAVNLGEVHIRRLNTYEVLLPSVMSWDIMEPFLLQLLADFPSFEIVEDRGKARHISIKKQRCISVKCSTAMEKLRWSLLPCWNFAPNSDMTVIRILSLQ